MNKWLAILCAAFMLWCSSPGVKESSDSIKEEIFSNFNNYKKRNVVIIWEYIQNWDEKFSDYEMIEDGDTIYIYGKYVNTGKHTDYNIYIRDWIDLRTGKEVEWKYTEHWDIDVSDIIEEMENVME